MTDDKQTPLLGEKPGYRRRIRIIVEAGTATALLEDDYHCMAVTLQHSGGIVTQVIPDMARAPWSTCPGAMAKLIETFTGLPLGEVTARREKTFNCTHLHDLAVLAAAHTGQPGITVYDIAVSDAAAGQRAIELRRGDALVLRWTEQDGVLTAPEGIAGRTLPTLRDWIAALPEPEREAARLLQWAAMVAHGRSWVWEPGGAAPRITPNCYTFQPERVIDAYRVGAIVDFISADRAPLDGLGGPYKETMKA